MGSTQDGAALPPTPGQGAADGAADAAAVSEELGRPAIKPWPAWSTAIDFSTSSCSRSCLN